MKKNHIIVIRKGEDIEDEKPAQKDSSDQVKIHRPKPIESVRLHFRPLNQTVDWQHVEMKHLPDGEFEAIIPAEKIAARYDLQYDFEVLGTAGAGNWPRWQDRQPYYIVKTQP